jgi:DNA-binding transcriptional MerR regulator
MSHTTGVAGAGKSMIVLLGPLQMLATCTSITLDSGLKSRVKGDVVKIGEVARNAGVSIDTVRFYERRGVLPAPERQPSGYRTFTESAVARIKMTRALQDMGFTLDEVIDALRAHDAGGATCDSERWRLEAVVDRIDARIAGLRRARRNTMKILEECRAGRCQFASPSC